MNLGYGPRLSCVIHVARGTDRRCAYFDWHGSESCMFVMLSHAAERLRLSNRRTRPGFP
jgi:hypothetical protein